MEGNGCHPVGRDDSARRFIRRDGEVLSGQLPASWNDPSVTACGRASSPQRGAGLAGARPSLWRALLRAPKRFRLERRLHTNGGRKPDIASSPRPRGRAQNAAGAALPQTCNVCGRVHPPSSSGGGDPQEGVKTPFCPRGGRGGRIPARDARAIPQRLSRQFSLRLGKAATTVSSEKRNRLCLKN